MSQLSSSFSYCDYKYMVLHMVVVHLRGHVEIGNIPSKLVVPFWNLHYGFYIIEFHYRNIPYMFKLPFIPSRKIESYRNVKSMKKQSTSKINGVHRPSFFKFINVSRQLCIIKHCPFIIKEKENIMHLKIYG